MYDSTKSGAEEALPQGTFVSWGATVYEDMETSDNWLDRAVNQLSSQKMEVFMCLSDCSNTEDPT